ncbi:MAG TPA: hypothetical protein VHL54_06335 [Actinomycetota bacterium]|nr:hypothetical protein [Actinomycetota bacterium]
MNAALRTGRKLLAAVALPVVLAACSPPGLTSAAPDPDESRRLEPGIVRAVDLLAVPELGPVRRLTEAEVPDYQGPEFRGECGRAVAQPQASRRLAAAFVGEQATLSEVIVELDADEAGKLIRDLREGDSRCDPEVTRTPQGQSQTYRHGPVVDIGEVGEDRVATRGTLEVDGTTVSMLTILIRDEGLVLYGLVSTEGPLREDAAERLAEVMEDPFEELAS